MSLARRAAELLPNHGEILDRLGWAYAQKGMLQEADATLKQAVTLSPSQPSIRYHLGVVHHKLGRQAEAASEIRRALQSGADFPESEKAREVLASIGR